MGKLKILRGEKDIPYGFAVEYKDKMYNLSFCTPQNMLIDQNISWECKGYLSHLCFISEDIDCPDHIIQECFEAGYLYALEEE